MGETIRIDARDVRPGDVFTVDGIRRLIFTVVYSQRTNTVKLVCVCPRDLPMMINGGNLEFHGFTKMTVERPGDGETANDYGVITAKNGKK